MERESHFTSSYPGDMTMWMFEDHPRFDYHLRQFVKRYELECKNNSDILTEKERDKSKELVLL
ncbi:MAG: hypothetical protein AB1782_09385 [Cyanobacteriota bacterium]